jgi:phage/plasmid-associated DNA primase
LAEYFLNGFEKYTLRYTGSRFYAFYSHRWNLCEEGVVARDVSDFLSTAYSRFIQKQSDALADEQERGKLTKLLYRVENLSGLNAILGTIRVIVTDQHFERKLNQSRHLIGYKNGVLDLSQNDGTFRDGKEEDYISFCTDTNFSHEYDADDMKALENIFWKICCENKTRYDCLLEVLGRSLCGDNVIANQKFYCFFGDKGANGKSTIVDMLNYAFGKGETGYCQSLVSTFVTQNFARSDSASGDLVTLSGKRFLFMSETEKKDGVAQRLNSASVKMFTGDNVYTYRGLYDKKLTTSLVTFTPFLLSNDKQTLDSDDAGLKRRFIYVPMKAKFLKPSETAPEHTGDTTYYPSENFTSTYIKRLAEGCLVHLLLRYYTHEKIINFPEEIIAETESLINSTDELREMLDHTFERTDNPNEGVSWVDMKNILENEYTNAWRTVRKKAGTDQACLERIVARLPYAKYEGVSGGQQIGYIDAKKKTCEKARRLFKHIRVRTDNQDG